MKRYILLPALFLLATASQASSGEEQDYTSEQLMDAIYNKREELARLILDEDPELVNYIGSNNYTPLTLAARNRDQEMVKLLLEKGADTNMKDGYGSTPLIEAVCNRDQEIIKLLLEKGADPCIENGDGYTAIGVSKARGHKDITTLLESAAGMSRRAKLLIGVVVVVGIVVAGVVAYFKGPKQEEDPQEAEDPLEEAETTPDA